MKIDWTIDGIEPLDGVTIDGKPVGIASWWACACSGGHTYGFTPKCAMKGGGTEYGLVVDGELIKRIDA